MTRAQAILLSILAFLVPPGARAELLASPAIEFREAQVRLLGQRGADGRFEGGLEIRLAEGFKTYWKFAGDSGIPPHFDFGGSRGLGAPEVRFPFPLAFDDGAGGKAYGYTKAVVLPITAQADAGAVLALKLDFAVCGTLCIPLAANLTLDVTKAARAGAASVALLAAARSALPGPLGAEGVSIRRLPAKGAFALRLPYGADAAGMDAFPDAPGFFEVKGITPVAPGVVEVVLQGEPAPGKTTFGPLHLTYGTAQAAFERMIDVDAATP